MAQRPKRRWNLIAITAVLIAALLTLSSVHWLETSPVVQRNGLQRSEAMDTAELISQPRSTREDSSEREQAPYTVEVGFYVNTTSELELHVPSYSAGGYVWLHWQEPLQRYLERNNTTIDKRLVLLNTLIADAEPGLQPIVPTPDRLADGSYYQSFKFQGRFYINNASFRRYPFVRINLPITLEADDIDGQLDFSNLRLNPDRQNSGIGLYAHIIGWLNHGWSIAEYRHVYATNFGLDGAASVYSQIVYAMTFGTSAWASFWRFLLPLLVVMSMVLLVFKVRSDEQDARASIPVTVLLTLVFLQQGHRDALPDLPYLSFLDQVYVVAYVVTLIAFVLVIWIGRRYADLESCEDGPSKQAKLERLEQLDVIWPLAVVVFGATAITACWFTIPAGL